MSRSSQAILKLLHRHNPTNKEDVYTTVLSQLVGPPTPSSRNLSERHFIIQALRLLFYCNRLDVQLTVVMLVHYTEGDSDLKRILLDHLVSHGLEDPYSYLTREMGRREEEVLHALHVQESFLISSVL